MIPVQKDSRNEKYPMVSIIIPAKNEAWGITACLESLLATHYPKDCYEIILVDNGSTDDTAQTATGLGVKVYVRPELTISGLRNFGASVAVGEILAFIDADIVVSRDWLSSVVNRINHGDEIGCVGCLPSPPEGYGWVTESWWLLQLRAGVNSGEEVSWLPSANFAVKKEAFESVGGFNTSLVTCEDVDFCYRLGVKYKMVHCSEMEATHYGEIKSLKELFRKERWRGGSNYAGVKVHGFRIDELPSLLLPIYYVVLALSFIIAAITWNWGLLGVNIIGWFLPPIIKSYWAAARNSKFNLFHKMVLCYLVYCLARSAALLDWVIGKGRRRK
jgi:glycosyltransferase involved in cell wall biosynthesis